MNADKAVVKALQAAAKAHHDHSAARFDTDPDWAEWYARFLLDDPGFLAASQRQWEAAELAQALNDLHAAYQRTTRRHHWSKYYAERLLQ